MKRNCIHGMSRPAFCGYCLGIIKKPHATGGPGDLGYTSVPGSFRDFKSGIPDYGQYRTFIPYGQGGGWTDPGTKHILDE